MWHYDARKQEYRSSYDMANPDVIKNIDVRYIKQNGLK